MAGKIDLKELYPSDEEFLKSLETIKKDIENYQYFEGHLYDSAKNLYDFLEFDTKISKELEKLYTYAHINSDLDLSNTKYQEYVGKVLSLIEQIEEKTAFATPEILLKDYDYILNLIKLYPKLSEYRLMLKKIFRLKEITRTKEEEELINTLTTSYDKPEEISEMLINTDLKYGTIKDENNKEIELTNSNYSTYFESAYRNVRKSAFNAVYKEFKEHAHTFGTILNTEVINNNRIAKIRNFTSARDLSLFRNEVNPSIYDNLIKGVHNNLNRFFKYFDLKKDILGLDELHIYDTYANITKKYDKTYSYDDAKKIVLGSLAILGNNYISNLNKAFDNNWIDSTICKTKRSGAYATAAYTAHPYVVLSYEGKVNDISTLAHELGHAMHYQYAIQTNNFQYYNYSIFVAEVASQVNEILLTDYLFKKSNDTEEKKYLLDMMLQRFKATIVRQTMFAEYEQNIHNLEKDGVILTPERLEDEYYKLNELYFGKNVVVDNEIRYECYRIPHFYYDFYVYQYATGYAAAMKIANDILSGKEGAVEKYLDFLTLGSTKDPVESLKVAGVDIEDEKIYDEVFMVFENKLKALRSLYE